QAVSLASRALRRRAAGRARPQRQARQARLPQGSQQGRLPLPQRSAEGRELRLGHGDAEGAAPARAPVRHEAVVKFLLVLLCFLLAGCSVGLTVTNSPDTLPCAPASACRD